MPAYYDLWAQLGRLEAYDNFRFVGLLNSGDTKCVSCSPSVAAYEALSCF